MSIPLYNAPGHHADSKHYIQANAETRTKVFTAPDDKAFDIVFDFTAGSVTSGTTEEIMVQVHLNPFTIDTRYGYTELSECCLTSCDLCRLQLSRRNYSDWKL